MTFSGYEGSSSAPLLHHKKNKNVHEKLDQKCVWTIEDATINIHAKFEVEKIFMQGESKKQKISM
jgi:hypothetical protein